MAAGTLNWTYRLRKILSKAGPRARRKGVPFTITLDWVLRQLVAQGYCCKRTGMPFQLRSERTGEARNPWAPSIDRLDCSKGYTPDNVELVAYIYNNCKNTFTHEEVVEFAEAVFSRK